MWSDLMEDWEISQQVAQECDRRVAAEEDPGSDPSLYAPWGTMFYPPDYHRIPCNRPD